MTEDPPTTEFPAVEGGPVPPAAPPAGVRRLRPWMWIAPGVILVAVAAFIGGRAVASSASAPTSAPAPVAAAPTSGAAATPSTPITTPSGPSTAAGSGGSKAGKGSGVKASSVVGVLKAMSGSTWTVEKTDGTTVQFTITSTTKFGTKARPETAGEFKTGQSVLVVTGKQTTGQSGVTAKRLVSRMKAPMTAGSTPGGAPTTA